METSNQQDDSDRETSKNKNRFSSISDPKSLQPRPNVSPYDSIDASAPLPSSGNTQPPKRQKVGHSESQIKTPDTASETGHSLLKEARLADEDALHNTTSVSSELSPASAVTDVHSNRDRVSSPVGKRYDPAVPRAPPSTPASQTNLVAFDGTATPLPIRAEVMNSSKLLQQHMFPECAETPAPTRTSETTTLTAAMTEDFSEWAVGDRYQMMRLLGRGSYGEVAQALDLSTGKPDAFVAIKRIRSPFDQEIDAIRLYRELHILRHMRGHQCIIQLLDVVQPPSDDIDDFHDLYLVFEYVDTDLWKLIMSPQYLTTEHIQAFLYQMLVALKYIHSFSVIHRDLKPANILLNEDCSLKICDFGLARMVSSKQIPNAAKEKRSREPDKPNLPPLFPKLPLTRQLTKHVVTRWYRAPELILVQPYTSAVDIWSLGCILAELLSMQDGNVPSYENRKPLFPGGACYPLSGDGAALKKDERIDQLSTIFDVIGSPSEEDLQSIGCASEYVTSLGKKEGKPFEKIFPAASPKAIDLLTKMLQFNPIRRITAHDALEHDFFKGIRQAHLEMEGTSEIRGPDFMESDNVDLVQLKRAIFEEARWYASPKEQP